MNGKLLYLVEIIVPSFSFRAALTPLSPYAAKCWGGKIETTKPRLPFEKAGGPI